MKALIRTRRCDVTAERGAYFHPTIAQSLLTDLPLASPELDHDALRENSFFGLSNRQGRMLLSSSYKLLATGFFIPSKDSCMSTSSVTQHPRLSSCIITPLATSCDQNMLLFQFFLEHESLVSLLSFSLQVPLCPPCLPFLPSSTRLCVAQIPSLWSGLKALPMGAFTHPLINS
jgi:hypothetical protein